MYSCAQSKELSAHYAAQEVCGAVGMPGMSRLVPCEHSCGKARLPPWKWPLEISSGFLAGDSSKLLVRLRRQIMLMLLMVMPSGVDVPRNDDFHLRCHITDSQHTPYVTPYVYIYIFQIKY